MPCRIARLTWHIRATQYRCVALALMLTLTATLALAEAPEKYPEGRIYAEVYGTIDGQSGRHLVTIDPQTGRCETVVPTDVKANMGHPRVSPEGKSLAYATSMTNRHSEVWVKRLLADDEPQRVWAGDGSARACWTPDGNRLIVVAGIEREGGAFWHNSYWQVNPATSETEAIELPGTAQLVDCAHRRDLLLLSSSRERASLFSMQLDGTSAMRLTRKGQEDYQGRFSPDDKRVAVLRSENGVHKICTADIDGSNVRLVLLEKGMSNFQVLSWSPDGKRLAVVMWDWILVDGRKRRRVDLDHNYRIAVVDADGGNYHELMLDRPGLEIYWIDWR